MKLKFEERLAEAWPASRWGRVRVIVAVSGGADSVALLRGLAALAESPSSTLIAAHFDHQLRPDSRNDAEFVRQLCEQLQLPCELGDASQQTETSLVGGSEAAARVARYRFLRRVARRAGARYIATAHNADDQIETILHRIVRGTGIRGLTGIPFSRELVPGITLVRPLLAFTRAEIVEYLTELDQPYCRDETNTDERFTRNRIRHVLLPMLRNEYNPHVDQALQRLGALAGELEDYVEVVAGELLASSVCCTPTGAWIDLHQLAGVPPLIVRSLLRQLWRARNWPEQEMTFERWHELAQLASPDGPESSVAITLPGSLRVERTSHRLSIQQESQP